MIPAWVAVAVGGAVGALSRWSLTAVIAKHLSTIAGTLTCNLAGCLLIGVAIGLVDAKVELNERVQLAFVAGFLGSFTTFSTFAAQGEELVRAGSTWRATSLLVACCALGPLLVAGGRWITRAWT